MPQPEEYELITTLWYSTRENKLRNDQSVAFITDPPANAYDNIRSLYTNPHDSLGFGPLGNDFTISYTGVRTPVNNDNSAITFPSFKETFIINVPAGTIEASAVYYDRGSDDETSIDENIFTVSGGRGIFNGAVIAIIKYDKDGDILGEPFSRRIEVYKLREFL